MALKGFFAEAAKGGAAGISYVMSGGTERGAQPALHGHQPQRTGEPGVVADGLKSLAIGVARTRSFRPEELGRLPQVDAVADAVARAVMEAGITSPGDVHFCTNQVSAAYR
ncbi:ring-opening amidohydrolase [Paenibacillus rhizoplanae]